MEKCFKGADIYYILAAIPWVRELELRSHIPQVADRVRGILGKDPNWKCLKSNRQISTIDPTFRTLNCHMAQLDRLRQGRSLFQGQAE